MRTLLIFLLACCCTSIFANPEPPSEKLFRQMIVNRPNHLSQPGAKRTVTIHELQVSKPTNWTMEFGNNPAADKNTKVYKVICRFTIVTENYNTVTAQKYSVDTKEYKRAYNFYIDRSNKWVCMALGLTKDLY
ncbi:MAG: hypothetical protein JWQ96_1141 [Segetibacter sp.]|nr:hypothetical protein [Segetibacter sp.]